MKTAGLVLDFYDDRTGETLKTVYPSADDLPEQVKVAHILSQEERQVLRDEAYALILHSDDGIMRKFACVDEGNTHLSTLYFLANAEKLPAEAIKTAAQNLIAFNEEFGLEVPFHLKLAAETGKATLEKTALIEQKHPFGSKPVPAPQGPAGWADPEGVPKTLEGRKKMIADHARRLKDEGGTVARKLKKVPTDDAFQHLNPLVKKLASVEKTALVGVDDLVGGVVGYNYGKKQKERGEGYGFGVPQALALALPGGAGYQIGRGLAHANKDVKKGKSKEKKASMARKRDSFKQPVVGDDADWAQRTNLISPRGGSDAGRVIPTANQMKTAGVAKEAMLGSSGISMPARVPRPLPAAPKKLTGKALTAATSKAEADFWKRGPKQAVAPKQKAAGILGSSGLSLPSRISRPLPPAKKLTGKALSSATSKAEADFWKRGPKMPAAPAAKAKAASVEKVAYTPAELHTGATVLGGGLGALKGAIRPGKDEQGRNKSRVKGALKGAVKGAVVGNLAAPLIPAATQGVSATAKVYGDTAKSAYNAVKDRFKKTAHVSNLVDVSQLRPAHQPKTKTASRTALDGKYSLDSYSDVQQALRFFDENWTTMDPADRHEFAVKTASRADELGIATSEYMDRYGSTEYGPDVEAHLANRAAVDPDHRIVWDDLKEKQAMIEPEQFASLLREADELFGLDAYWGGAVMDPYFATFGGRGQEKVAWAHQTADGETIDEAALRAIPREQVEKNFAPDFAEAFSQNPTLIFDSMPADSKQVLARMARSA